MGNDYRLGQWLVRPQRDCIERGGRTVHVKPKAMAVLERLARARGEVVTRNDLFEAVWPGGVVSDATLTQCIVELRQAFGDSARQPEIIETIPKVGFRLIPEVVAPADEGAPESGTGMPSLNALSQRTILATVVALLLILVSILLATRETQAPTPGEDTKTLAVLPFADTSKDTDQGWLADGLSDELINRLSQLEGLLVTGRTDSFRFKDSRENLESVAEMLRVRHVLEGSVRRDGDRIRITAQLVDARTGFNLWSETFERAFGDIFTVQDEIAESVAVALSIRLGVGELGTQPGSTSNLAAYEEWLKASELRWKQTSESILLALEHARNAVEIDPEFATGWMTLARLYFEARRDPSMLNEWLPAADRAMERARSLEPALPGLLVWDHEKHVQKYEWREAEGLLFPDGRFDDRKQRELLFHRADFLYKVGRVREATPLMERQRRISPLGPGTAMVLGHIYLAQSRMDEALAEYERAYELEGYTSYTVVNGVVVAMASGDRAELEKWLERVIAHQLKPKDRQLFETMAGLLDDRLAALAWLRDTFEGSVREDFLDYYISIWAAWFGDMGLALAAMHRTPDNFFLWIPQMREVRRQPGFKDLVRKMNLEEYWRASAWPDYCRPLGESDFVCE